MINEENSKSGNYINIIITQAICMVIILISVLVVTYFFKPEYAKAKKWYNSEIVINTDINEVLK